jgi:hypothetical protein
VSGLEDSRMPDVELPDHKGEVVTAAIDSDTELLAIRAVLSALVPLKHEARSRVIDYVFKRLGLTVESEFVFGPTSSPVKSSGTAKVEVSPVVLEPPTRVQDIRSLTQQKSPRSANEMAALVAYYVSDVAPPSSRKDFITSDDLKTHFKQAGFKLPSSAKMTLVNAKNSGYLESVGEGRYRLNPVGYNLVVHGLPSRSETKRLTKLRKTRKANRSR